MGILIQFPQFGTRIPAGRPPSSESAPQDERLAAAYRRDLDRAVNLLLEHVQTDAYDGLALILKPKAPGVKPAFVVGGLYRHRLADAADAAMQLHLAIKLRAREQVHDTEPRNVHLSRQLPRKHHEGTSDQSMQEAPLRKRWNDATARYHRCEHMLRIAFSKELRASPETTAILLSITQLHIEIVANCLWELVRRPGRATPHTKLETLNAIQLFRNVRAQVSAWMPPAGKEEAYFSANMEALSEEMINNGEALLKKVEQGLERIVGDFHTESVGTYPPPQ